MRRKTHKSACHPQRLLGRSAFGTWFELPVSVLGLMSQHDPFRTCGAHDGKRSGCYRRFMRLLTFTVVLILSASGFTAKAQDAALPFNTLVSITVAEERHLTLAHEIIITADEAFAPRTQAQLQGRGWTATRVSQRGVQKVSSNSCLALQPLALSFSELPDIPVDPMQSRIHDDAQELAPTRKDGFSTRLRFMTRTDDGSYGTVEMVGGNAYSQWGHEAVTTLIGCWGPLTP